MTSSSPPRFAVTVWSVAAVALALAEGVFRLGARAARTIAEGLDGPQWLALAASVAALCYFEGHRALQLRFVPSVLRRAEVAGHMCRGCFGVLAAPLFALSLIGTDRQTGARAWLGVASIVLAVLGVRELPAPWRGIVDAGVAAALAWGLVALVHQFARWGLRRRAPAARPESAQVFSPPGELDVGRHSSATEGGAPR